MEEKETKDLPNDTRKLEVINVKQETNTEDDNVKTSNVTDEKMEVDKTDDSGKSERVISSDEVNKSKRDETKETVKVSRGRKRTKTNRSDRSRHRSSASHSSEFSVELRPPLKRNGMTFELGAKLRARDFSQKWYDAKIIDIDEDRGEIKIHFDRWNSRFDQWIRMDSKDLRAFSPERLKQVQVYKVGDEVLAKWRDQQMYPAKVEKVFENGSFLVIFYDGFVNKMHTTHMQPLPSKCVGKLRFPTLEEIKKSKKSSIGNTFTSFFLNANSMSQEHGSGTKQDQYNEPSADFWEALQISPPASVVSDLLLEKKAVKEFIIEEDHNHFKCTVPDCNKAFRKEKLLESHLKHYHNMSYHSPTQSSRKRPLEAHEKSEPVPKKKLHIASPERPKIEKKPLEPINEKTVVESCKSEEKPKLHRKYISKPTISSILPMRSSTRRVSLPAKFASEEICLMQPLGRDRTVSSSEVSMEKKNLLRKEKAPHKDAAEFNRTKKVLPSKETHLSVKREKSSSRERPVSGDKKTVEGDIVHKKTPSSLKLSTHDDTNNDVDLVTKGLAVARKMSLEQFPDHDRIERMITIASSSKKGPIAASKSGIIQITSSALHRQKSRKSDNEKSNQSLQTKAKPSPSETTTKVKETITKVKETITKVKEENKPAALKQPLLASVLSAPPLNQLPPPPPTEVSEKVAKTAETIAEVTNNEPKKDTILSNSLAAVAMSLNEILSSSLDNSKTLSDAKQVQDPKLPEIPPVPVTPSGTGHVMCTRRKEAILEKEKATQMIGGHVMCTRKKSEKLAAVEQKFKRKILSPGRIESPSTSSPTSPPGVKRRRVFSVPRESARTDTSEEPKDPTFAKTFKVEPPDTHDSGTGSVTQEDDITDKTIIEEVVHCVCGCWEEEGLMMQCEICLTWQHGSCFNIEEEKDVPDKYVCYACLDPKGVRESQKFNYDQTWFKKGEMPTFALSPQQAMPLSNAEGIQGTHSLVASLHNIVTTLRSLNHKINIVSAESHPDLSLFHKSYIEESDEAETDDKENKNEDQEPTLSASSSQENVNKHKLTTQNLVTFDHSYYSPEVDILDLDAMPLIIDDDFKSENSKDCDSTANKSQGTNVVNVKEIVEDILSVDREKLQLDIIEANTSSSTESANEAVDAKGYSKTVDRSKETTLSTDEDSNLNSAEPNLKTSAQSSKIPESVNFTSKNIKLVDENKNAVPVKESTTDATKSKDVTSDSSTRAVTKDSYTAETSFCKPVSSTSNFFSGLNEAGELILPLTSERKEDLLSDFNFNAKCKRNLMDHIKSALYQLEPELDRVEELVEALEKEEFQRQSTTDVSGRVSQKGILVPNYRRLKRLRKDLQTVSRMSNFPVQRTNN